MSVGCDRSDAGSLLLLKPLLVLDLLRELQYVARADLAQVREVLIA